jgi:hypothetical protein
MVGHHFGVCWKTAWYWRNSPKHQNEVLYWEVIEGGENNFVVFPNIQRCREYWVDRLPLNQYLCFVARVVLVFVAKWYFQKTLILVFLQEESNRTCGCKWSLLKVRKGKYKRTVGCRWSPLAESVCFSFSGAFKTYSNPWEGQTQKVPMQ